MIKTNPELKPGLTDEEMIGFIKKLADSYFTVDVEGNIDYVPYMARIAYRCYFFLYCVDGIEFEVDSNGELEDILETIDADEELSTIYKDYLDGKYDHLVIVKQLSEISLDALDMVCFRKERVLREKRDSLDHLLDTFSKKMASIDLSGFDISSLSDALVSSYLKTDVYKENHNDMETEIEN